MIELIDFSNDKVSPAKSYNGANGSKICIIHDGIEYMLKFPAISKKNEELHYSNAVISEYLGSSIYKTFDIDTQEVKLGKYTKKGKTYDVVACKDFATDGVKFFDFASLKNTVVGCSSSGKGTELSDVLDAIEEQIVLDPKIVIERFWDMFVVDAYLGNFDRHNGNWGYLHNEIEDIYSLAPVFDCGSCLYSQADDIIKKDVINDEGQRNARIYNFPVSALKINDKKISYFDFLTTTDNKDCIDALNRFFDRFKENEIFDIIDNTPISDLSKEFYKVMLSERKEKILDKAYALNFNQSKIR